MQTQITQMFPAAHRCLVSILKYTVTIQTNSDLREYLTQIIHLKPSDQEKNITLLITITKTLISPLQNSFSGMLFFFFGKIN